VFATDVLFAAERLGVASVLADVWGMTQTLFPGPIGLNVVPDPEIAELTILEFQVTARGSIPEIQQVESEWIRRSFDIAGEESVALTICIIPQVRSIDA
jgi:hypothetical protein